MCMHGAIAPRTPPSDHHWPKGAKTSSQKRSSQKRYWSRFLLVVRFFAIFLCVSVRFCALLNVFVRFFCAAVSVPTRMQNWSSLGQVGRSDVLNAAPAIPNCSNETLLEISANKQDSLLAVREKGGAGCLPLRNYQQARISTSFGRTVVRFYG